ncbi:MAG TPA: efflux RND transporter periplasmic adaptor subunit [Gemmatimonadales bacterium]|nr:efflux RND transporter periplasmic adaptor subunit [Gemmatimonadales bacterium]
MRRTLALLLLGIAACSKADGAPDGAGTGGGPGGDGPPAMPVEVVSAVADTVVDAILSTGQIEAINSVELRPDIEGRIAEILVREGSTVSKGQPLVQVDDAELKAEVARAEAERDLARQSLARTRELLAQKASSQSELERTEATARSTEAAHQLLKVRLDRTTVRAPFSGVAGRRLVSLGDYVTTSTGLMTLQTVSPQRAVFQVPERYAEKLKVGQEVTFRVAALPGREFSGRVDFVDPVVQLPGRTITVKAQVPNPRRELQSGMFIEVRLATDVRPSAVVIAEDAVLPIQGTNYVWVVVDGKATRRQVELGVRTPGFVEARSGVEAGEQAVVGGQERLAEGAPVTVTLVDRTPSSGRESVGGTTPAADTAGRATTARDTAGSSTDTAVADGAEAGASESR